MKTVLIKTAIISLLLIAGSMVILALTFDNDANVALWIAERTAMAAILFGSYRLAEKIYKACLGTGADN